MKAMQILIQGFGTLALIGTIVLTILFYYHKQTAAVWTTFATIVVVCFTFCLYWQRTIWKDAPTAQHPNTCVWGAFAFAVALSFIICMWWQNLIWKSQEISTPQKIKLETFKEGVFGILVSAFEVTTQAQKAKGVEVQGTIVSTLNARFAELGIQLAQARGIPTDLTSELKSHQQAVKVGEKYGAAMVIWGDITLAGVIPNITILDPIRDFCTIVKPETTLLKDTLTHLSLNELKEIRLPALTEEPTTIVCFVTALKYYSEGNFDKALDYFKKALPESPTKHIDTAPIFFYIGNIMFFKNEYDKAIGFYNKTIELNPKHAMALNNWGAAHTIQKNVEQAFSDFKQALKIDPDHALAYNNRGMHYHALGEYDKALTDYNRALEIYPEYTNAYCNRGRLYHEMKQYNKALLDYEKALRIEPDNSSIYNNCGLVYEAQGETDFPTSIWP